MKTRLEKIERLQSLQNTLQQCTRPVDEHDDPNSVYDCWNWMQELLAEIKDEDKKLLLCAEQFEKEQQLMVSQSANEESRYQHHIGILQGIKRINGLIKRHLGIDEK